VRGGPALRIDRHAENVSQHAVCPFPYRLDMRGGQFSLPDGQRRGLALDLGRGALVGRIGRVGLRRGCLGLGPDAELVKGVRGGLRC
jgi:hypothetical protein